MNTLRQAQGERWSILLSNNSITDETGEIQGVILDYAAYKRIEDILLDQGLLKAMEEVEDEESVDYEEVREFIQKLWTLRWRRYSWKILKRWLTPKKAT